MSDGEDALTCHYCGESFDIGPDDANLTVSWNDNPDKRPACGSCLADMAVGGELEPLPEFVDEDDKDDQDEDVEESDDERQTATCDNCGYTGPRKGDAEDGEKAVVWFEDSWMCQKCKYHDDRSFGGPPSGSRTPRRGGMGTGGLGRRER